MESLIVCFLCGDYYMYLKRKCKWFFMLCDLGLWNLVIVKIEL